MAEVRHDRVLSHRRASAAERRQHAGHYEGADDNTVDGDAGMPRGLSASAEEVEVPAPARAPKEGLKPQQRQQNEQHPRRPGRDRAEPLDDSHALGNVGQRLASALQEGATEALEDYHHAKGHDEGVDSDPGDQQAVDQPYQQPGQRRDE